MGIDHDLQEGRAVKQAIRESALTGMMQEVYENTVAKGWYDKERSFGDMVALLHSEVSEALEAFRDRGLEAAEEHYDVRCAMGNDCRCTPKPIGVGSELADVFIRLLDTCHRYGIDLANEYEKKMTYNRTRPYRHGGKSL